jgi:UrcA family protein
MNRGIIATCARSAVVTAMASMMLGALAVGQDNPVREVKIEASKVVTITEHSRTGIQNETVQLSRKISFSDLDLVTGDGAMQLEKRIRETAAAVCKQLGQLYPAGSASNEQTDQAACVKGAVDVAMNQAKVVIAFAKSNQ